MVFVVKCHNYTMKFSVLDYYIYLVADVFCVCERSTCKIVFENELSDLISLSLEPLSVEEVI